MGKSDQKAEENRYVQWKAQQILAQARERNRLEQEEQARKDRFKFWKSAPPAPPAPAATVPTPPPPPPTGIVAPATKRDDPAQKKEGLDKLKFWKKSEKQDTTVMIQDFEMQHKPRKPIVYKAPLRERISYSLSTKLPRISPMNCKLTTIIILIVVAILAVIFVPIILKVASLAI